MMWWYGPGINGWSYGLMTVSMVLFWALTILGVVALVRYLTRGDRGPTAAMTRPTPEELLAERFARGEIDEQEYRNRRETLSHEFRTRVRP